jgi:hypothetical protein
MSEVASVQNQPNAPSYAVLFRTHGWDAFIARQYDRVQRRCRSGDLFVVANNTSGECGNLPVPNVLTFTESDITAMGYARAGVGQMLWYNVDYALYYFLAQYPGYDYYVLFEYDVVINTDLDALINAVSERKMDLVGLTKGEPVAEWWFLPSCLELYAKEDIRKMLLPLAVFSRTAIEHLADRKLALSKRFHAGEVKQWPHCEAFIVTELTQAGFAIDEFDRYGSTARLNYAPAYIEQDLVNFSDSSFIHPLLDPKRYVENVLKYEWRPERFFLISSSLRRQLTKAPPYEYIPALTIALGRRISKVLRRLTERVSWSFRKLTQQPE